jgi:amino acid transporter
MANLGTQFPKAQLRGGNRINPPFRLGEVHPRFHTPMNALMLAGAGSIAALAAFVWIPEFATLVGIFGFILGFMVVSIAAMAFPSRLKDVFGSSPVKARVGGVPWMAIVGALSFVALAIMAWAFLTDPSAGLKGAPGADLDEHHFQSRAE